ncbi:hypothetical protein [Mesorhizobium sp.]|uniref:hypothetical protein n=1 Tax=Mesorhizobium sp. TaxID=1871066 RepID=UPI0025B9AC59|nr:hypothetical protein [Mesorhizobium sp.]
MTKGAIRLLAAPRLLRSRTASALPDIREFPKIDRKGKFENTMLVWRIAMTGFAVLSAIVPQSDFAARMKGQSWGEPISLVAP